MNGIDLIAASRAYRESRGLGHDKVAVASPKHPRVRRKLPWEKDSPVETASEVLGRIADAGTVHAKHAALGSYMSGAGHVAGDVFGGVKRWLSGRAIVPHISEQALSKSEIKAALRAATSAGRIEEARKLERVLDSVRFKQLAGWAGASYLGYQGLKGASRAAQAHKDYMDKSFGQSYAV